MALQHGAAAGLALPSRLAALLAPAAEGALARGAHGCHRSELAALRTRTCGSSSVSTALAGVGGITALTMGRARCRKAARRSAAPFFNGPTPVWDNTGGAAVVRSGSQRARFEPGKLQRVIWVCWTGHNQMPSHLRLCVKTIERNSGLPVILVTPENVTDFVPEPHPIYEYLHLQHRADYLRCCLLHMYGGIYLDADTICLRSLAGLFDQLDRYDAVGYDGSEWGELIGISDMGPFKPMTDLTQLWHNALHGKLHDKLPEARARQSYPFYWQEILRDIFVPASLMHRERVSQALQAFNPQQEALWSTMPAEDVLRAGAAEGSPLQRCHIFILNNAKYGAELGRLTEEQILGGPAVLSQVLRSALGVQLPAA